MGAKGPGRRGKGARTAVSFRWSGGRVRALREHAARRGLTQNDLVCLSTATKVGMAYVVQDSLPLTLVGAASLPEPRGTGPLPFRFPDPLLEEIRKYARRNNQTLTQMVTATVDEEIGYTEAAEAQRSVEVSAGALEGGLLVEEVAPLATAS